MSENMDFNEKIKQCSKPTGELGKNIVKYMNKNHFELTGWGISKIKISDKDNILDIGCGGGVTINRLAQIAKNGIISGIDYSIDCVELAKEYNKDLIKKGNVEILNASVENLPFKKNKFDLVTAIETIYFWPNLFENFKEVIRVLKPNGTFVIINEVYDNNTHREKNKKLKAAVKDMKILSSDELKNLLKESGFKNIQLSVIEENNWICYIAKV